MYDCEGRLTMDIVVNLMLASFAVVGFILVVEKHKHSKKEKFKPVYYKNYKVSKRQNANCTQQAYERLRRGNRKNLNRTGGIK